MARKRAADVSAEKAAILGPETFVPTSDEPVLRLEPVPYNWAELEAAARRVRNQEIHERWQAVGGGDPAGRRPSPPTKGSVCSYCGATDQVLASAQASGPWRCAYGCS
jgi:hypothetical protein